MADHHPSAGDADSSGGLWPAIRKLFDLDGGERSLRAQLEETLDEAEHLFQLCKPGIIDKTRYLVKCGNHTFEVDEFYGDNEGLVMAEVELSAPDEPFEKPDFIGFEVTGDGRFYNGHLRKFPFKLWGSTLSEEYR